MGDRKVWFITGASRVMGVAFTPAALAAAMPWSRPVAVLTRC